MPIPDFQTIMLPLLKALSDGNEHKMKDIVGQLTLEFKLTEDEKKELQI